MIDTHCHLLPALDDGPVDERASLDLAASLVAVGVTYVVCTPHFSTRYPTEQAEALRAESALVRRLERDSIDLEIALAAEVTPERAVAASPDELRARSIGGRFLLVELLSDTPVVSFATISRRLDELGMVPVFAHPERCRALHRSLAALDDVRKEGALVQVVATSLTGRWGTETETLAWRLVDTGRADLLASDAHRKGHAASFERAAMLVGDRLGEGVRDELTRRRPERVLAGIHPEAGTVR